MYLLCGVAHLLGSLARHRLAHCLSQARFRRHSRWLKRAVLLADVVYMSCPFEVTLTSSYNGTETDLILRRSGNLDG